MVFFLLFHVFGYRKGVALTNLRNSFPDKADKELLIIRKQFFRYFCDLFIETFKTLTISPAAMLRHSRLDPSAKQLFASLAEKKQSIIMVMGHYGNWEWGGNTFALECLQQLYVIYHPLGNHHFDGLMYRMRTRFGNKLIPMKNTFREMLANKQAGVNATAFIADQTPQPDNAYWTTFLNQDTPVFWGTEIISKKLDLPIVYVTIRREKRGYYRLYAEMLVPEPSKTATGEISELHTRRLEKDIIEDPTTWLWSHRRWKHKRPV